MCNARRMTERTNQSMDVSDLKWKVGDRFRKAREARTSYTRLSIAEAIGCSRDTIQKIEEGDEIPKPYLVMAYSNLTGVPIDYFRQVESSEPPDPDDTPDSSQRPRVDSNHRPTAYNSRVVPIVRVAA